MKFYRYRPLMGYIYFCAVTFFVILSTKSEFIVSVGQKNEWMMITTLLCVEIIIILALIYIRNDVIRMIILSLGSIYSFVFVYHDYDLLGKLKWWHWYAAISAFLLSSGMIFLGWMNNIFLLSGRKFNAEARMLTVIASLSMGLYSLVFVWGAIWLSLNSRNIVILSLLICCHLVVALIIQPFIIPRRFRTRRSGPVIAAPAWLIAQDAMSSAFVTILGWGFISWFYRESGGFLWDVLLVVSILGPLSPMFMFFLENNVKHVDGQAEKWGEEFKEYSLILENHCYCQNLIAVMCVLPLFLLGVIVAEARQTNLNWRRSIDAFMECCKTSGLLHFLKVKSRND